MIGIPHMGTFPHNTVAALLNLVTGQKLATQVGMMGLSLVYIARQELVNAAIEQGFTHIFFMDSDMVPPADTITKLLAHDKDIVSGMAFKRNPPFEPCFYTDMQETEQGLQLRICREWEDGELKEVVACGLACCLIKLDVFKKLMETDKKIFMPKDDTGEDVVFCIKATEAGYKIYVDTTIDVGHVASFESNSQHWRAARDSGSNASKE